MPGKTCQICQNPSGMYPLCSYCFKLRDEGKVLKCSTCNVWYKVDENCACNFEPLEEDKELEQNIDNPNNNLTECLLCTNPSKGYLFCYSCYNKYKNKALILKITNGSDIEIMDESYEGKHVCEDGHVVKSKSEMLIDNYLFSKGITHAYEKAFPIDSNPEHDLYPDFYLPDQEIYLEHWGYSENEIYTKQKEYKLAKYKEQGITLICTTEKDMSDPSRALERKLKFVKMGEINE